MGHRRHPIPPTVPEPRGDIRAQLGALRDPKHPKNAVFIAKGNEAALPRGNPAGITRVDRPEGTLLTTNQRKAETFARGASDNQMARIIGAPQPKSKIDPTKARVTQAQDRHGNVVHEAASGPGGHRKTTAAVRKQVPDGGRLVKTTPTGAIARRVDLVRRGK